MKSQSKAFYFIECCCHGDVLFRKRLNSTLYIDCILPSSVLHMSHRIGRHNEQSMPCKKNCLEAIPRTIWENHSFCFPLCHLLKGLPEELLFINAAAIATHLFDKKTVFEGLKMHPPPLKKKTLPKTHQIFYL